MAAQFEFVFVEMGQGDCCMARCPDGRIVVIDCGSTSNKYGDPNAFIEAQILLRSARWAGGNSNKVDALILTHSDRDHYNKVVAFFNEVQYLEDVKMPSTGIVIKKPKLGKIYIDNIYFSNSASDVAPLRKYRESGLNRNVYSHLFGTRRIYEITINSETDASNKYKTWVRKGHFKTLASTDSIDDKRFVIFSGTTEGKKWSVSIIAGNVPKGYKETIDYATEENAKSLVTLFEVGWRKALLCGDMTFSTEKFLRDNHEENLTDILLVQIPHHGSANASAADTIKMFNPMAAVASVGFLEHSHHLPKHEKVLDKWIENIQEKEEEIDAHDLDYWTTKNEKSKELTDDDIEKKKDQWTNNRTDFSKVDRNESDTFWCLQKPAYGVFGLYKCGYERLFLFREGVTTNLTLTSEQTQVYYLDETGIKYKGINP